METVSDIGAVYPAIEAALHAVTGLAGGFPAYLGGGVGQLINRWTGRSDELPSDVGSRFAKAATFQPVSERGKRLTERLMLPLTALMEGGEKAGHKVTDITGSPGAGALTEATVQMAPALLGRPIAKLHDATLPKYTGKEGARARGPVEPTFEPPPEPAPPPSAAGTSSGVPMRLDKLIAEAERLGGAGQLEAPPKRMADLAEKGTPPGATGTGTPLALDRLIAEATRNAEGIQVPDVKGAIRDIKRAGPGIRQGEMQLEPPPEGVRPGLPEAQGAVEGWQPVTTPEAARAPAAAPERQPYVPYNPDKEYPTRPIVVPRSEIRGEKSGGKTRKVYELVQANTPFERVLANSGRDWQTKAAQDKARAELVAAVRQLSGDDAVRFAKLKGLPPEKLVEAAQQYWGEIRTDLNNARLDKPNSYSFQIEAPDAERALFFERGGEPPAGPERPSVTPEAPEWATEDIPPVGDAEALARYGPGTLGANPMLDPGLIKDALDTGIKNVAGWANAIQNAPESARAAIAPLHEYARAVQAAKEIAQRDVIEPAKNAAAIQADYAQTLNEVLRVNPRFQANRPANPKEAAREIERAKREIAAAKMRKDLMREGYAIRRHADEVPGSEDVYREPPLNMHDLRDSSGRTLLIREDALPIVDQIVGAHDIAEQRRYTKSWVGKTEAANHATVSWLMWNPQFHLVTTAGKAVAYAVPAPGRTSILNYFRGAGETMNDRVQLSDWVKSGLQPFPVRAKMEPTGAEAGAFEKAVKGIGLEKPYEFYQFIHRRVLADNVNRIQIAFAQMRLEQQVRQAQARGETITPEKYQTFKTVAAQESNPIGGNLPREEMNRTLYRALGLGLFSRGLQASTVRMATRTIENNEIVRSVAQSKGFTPEEAKIITDRNRNFLMVGLLLDYAVMQTVANALNYATTAIYNEPDKNGKPGGHFVIDNPGSTNASLLFPNSIFLRPKTDEQGNRTGEGVYISNPIRTVRDIIEYMMIPAEIGGGTKPEVLFNKFSPLSNLGKGAMSGTDWAGRPLSGPLDVAAEAASVGMPSPLGDAPRYAAESIRTGDFSFLAEGIKRAFDPETAIPTLLGAQPRVSSEDPTTTQQARDQSVEERKLWARVSRVKQLGKRIDEETRERQIEAVVEDARKLGMPGSKINQIYKIMRNQGISKSQMRAAGRYQFRQEEGQIEPPPPEL